MGSKILRLNSGGSSRKEDGSIAVTVERPVWVLRTSIARAMPTRTSLSKDDNFDSTAVILTA
jgi:hypothetical protein